MTFVMHITEKNVSKEISIIKVEPSNELAILKISEGSFSVK
tara:strand:+ start:34 stop:156 length:123 start_codon:yes stop_codon:yes gene_type:complete